MKKLYSALLSAAALGIMASTAAQAGPTLVATIYGEYDTGGIADLPSAVTAGLTWYGNTGDYDTPALFFVNPTAFAITGNQMALLGYGAGTYNNGISQLLGLPNLPAFSVTEIAWGSPSCSHGVLFCYDYDDQYSSNFGANPGGAAGSAAIDCTLNVSHPEWANFCAPTGNFGVTYTGIWGNGSQSVFSVFSPSSNATPGFVGWEGLDPNGWSENATYDVHTGIVTGVLANIYIGTPPVGVPEPLSLSLFGAGLAGAFGLRRRLAKKA